MIMDRDSVETDVREQRRMAGHLERASAYAAVGGSVLVGLAALGVRAVVRRVTDPGTTENRFFTPWELGVPYEEVAFRTPDGLVLRGWWLEHPDPQRTVVALAGHNGARHHALGIGAVLWHRGANVLLFDNRGRGSSDGDRGSLGYFETLDASAAVGYALSRSDKPLGLLGFSMGAAVAVMVAARDARVGAVVADSPFASQRGLLRSHLRRYLGPAAGALVKLSERFLPYDMEEVEPIREVAGISPRTCLFIHGELDETTDPHDSRKLYEAAGEPKELWLLDGVDHCGAYFADRAAYSERVSDFFKEHLTPRPDDG